MPDFDVVVVGGGPAGAASAFECSKQGLNVLLLERDVLGRHKPCGGVFPPVCADVISETFKMNLPKSVMCSPETLGLCYVPPSGKKNSGVVKNYRLLNVNRDLFDRWLCELIKESGVQVWYETEFLRLRRSKPIQFLAKKGKDIVEMTTRYLIGADGVHSRVRKQLYGEKKVKTAVVLQECWRAKGDFDDCFHIFFKEEVSPTFAYVIPKDGLYIIGVGTFKKHSSSISVWMDPFKEWLSREFSFKPWSLERRDIWAIPYGFILKGIGNVILAGDAAGFCNPLSGEGVRLAIESGVSAGNAIKKALYTDKPLSSIYINCVDWISRPVQTMYNFAINLTDEVREGFVKSELARISFP